MNRASILIVDGLVERSLSLSAHDVVPDAHELVEGEWLGPARGVSGVMLSEILDRAAVRPTARYVTLFASADGFSASIPLDAARTGVLVLRSAGEPLTRDQGGPVRFAIPDPAACGSAEVDACANVKHVDRIEVTADPGHDTRPKTVHAH